MENPIMVSVVIVSWNTRDFLAQCLKSLSRGVCDYPMEVLVVDNASTDGSSEYVEGNYPAVRLIRNDSNQGFAKANNKGIRLCRGKYICLINSDVEVLGNCITMLVDHCEANPETGMVGPSIIGGDGTLQRSWRGFPGLWN
ncbi:MAG: glycosyltransferase family 2 protein, partial [bacterium]